ncbi:MAG TPA: hypothetical protein PLO41_02360 [Rubrivivax sp.]|nr:hypothetical protein [Rubrivivax sp.]
MAATSRLAHHLRQALQEEGYRVHCGGRDDSPELAGRFWFTWSVAGMADCEVGPSCAGSWEAWAGALDHRLANSRIAMHRVDAASMPLAPFHAATLEIVRTHFGEENGDMFWLSIKRRDRAPVHDWRELQQIKNMIVGDEHEGFEVYPAESRLVDTANQYHVWVFVDPAVRLPVGYGQREVMDCGAAAAVGAWQRGFGTLLC